MTRYTFRMPISGTIEVTANGDSLDDAVENYMAGAAEAEAEIDLDYIENSDRVEALSYCDNDGDFVEL